MKEIVKTPSDPLDSTSSPSQLFKGYTLEELRYQRALVTLRKEFCQNKLLRSTSNLNKLNPLKSGKSDRFLPGKYGSLASKVLSGLNYFDYAMLGFSVFNSLRKFFSLFRKGKKK